MAFDKFLMLESEDEYRNYFESRYCSSSIVTFDGVSVRFRKDQFDHCCFESSQRNQVKDRFSERRAKRLEWIADTLVDETAILKAGWDGKKRRHDNFRRVAVVQGYYVVVIRFTQKTEAAFVTAYSTSDNPRTIQQILDGPDWQNPFA